MDPLQTSALNALEPFIALAPTANSPRAASDLISQAIAAPNTYFFAELLQCKNIQALRTAEDTQYRRWLKVLELFCWGTWVEYQATPDLPALSDAQAQKLRLLTLLTLAHDPSAFSYPSLQKALSLDTPAALETFITTAIYAGLISAKLDPLAALVDLDSVAPLRDPAPGSVPRLVGALDRMAAACVGMLGELEAQSAQVRRDARERVRSEHDWRALWEDALKVKGQGASAAPGALVKGAEIAVADLAGRGNKREVVEAGLAEENGGEGGNARDAKRGAGAGRFVGAGRRLG